MAQYHLSDENRKSRIRPQRPGPINGVSRPVTSCLCAATSASSQPRSLSVAYARGPPPADTLSLGFRSPRSWRRAVLVSEPENRSYRAEREATFTEGGENSEGETSCGQGRGSGTGLPVRAFGVGPPQKTGQGNLVNIWSVTFRQG